MLKEKLLKREYYYNKLSMFMRQSYGIKEQTKFMVEILNNIDDTIDAIFNSLDIFNEQYEELLEEYGSTEFKPLDLIASMVGTSRSMKLQVPIYTSETNTSGTNYLNSLVQIENDTVYVGNYYVADELTVIEDSSNFDFYLTEAKNYKRYENYKNLKGIFVEKINTTTTYKLIESFDETNENVYALIPKDLGDLNYTKVKISSATLKKGKDYSSTPMQIYYNLQATSSSTHTDIKFTTDTKTYEYEILNLSNKDLLKVIKMKIIKDNFSGTRESLTNLYKDIDMDIYILTDESGTSCSVYLDIKDKYYSTNIYKIFKFGNLFTYSLGVIYNKLITSEIENIFILDSCNLDRNFFLG